MSIFVHFSNITFQCCFSAVLQCGFKTTHTHKAPENARSILKRNSENFLRLKILADDLWLTILNDWDSESPQNPCPAFIWANIYCSVELELKQTGGTRKKKTHLKIIDQKVTVHQGKHNSSKNYFLKNVCATREHLAFNFFK